MKLILRWILFCYEVLLLPVFIIVALLSRLKQRSTDIGIGPEPLINNIYHKKSLQKFGYICETFVESVFHITHEFDRKFIFSSSIVHNLMTRLVFVDFLYCLFNYKALYLYFNGGPLGRSQFLWRFEPYLYHIASIKIVVMPYGSDHQLMDRTPNLYFKHCMAIDYPNHKLRYNKIFKKLILWTNNAHHVISGCDWVDYMYHWDTLMVSHFSIDIQLLRANDRYEKEKNKNGVIKPIKILHAPNHRHQKGTFALMTAVDKLKDDGYNIELDLAEKLPHQELIKKIIDCDVVVDQLVIGWYAMFAIEALTFNKPTICYLRDDLKELYEKAGILKQDELPFIEADTINIYSVLKEFLDSEKYKLMEDRGLQYVSKYHSLEKIGEVFHKINCQVGIPKSYEETSN